MEGMISYTVLATGFLVSIWTF